MTAPEPEEPKPPIHVFDCEGMNTLFTFRMHHADRSVARQLTGNCFRQLEELEAELSRYRHDSEVSRINALKTGESMLLADATYRCLKLSLEATSATAGLFDVTMGARTRSPDAAAAEGGGASSTADGKLTLSPDRPQITCEEEGREIDLGGIGKGFALDEMAAALQDLGIESALLSCGASTHLAFGPRFWPFDLCADGEAGSIEIIGQALSASGIGEQGAHVVHPDTGLSPEYAFQRVWVVAASAAQADAFSTACLLMDEEEIQSFAEAHREDGIVIHAESIEDGTVRRMDPTEL